MVLLQNLPFKKYFNLIRITVFAHSMENECGFLACVLLASQVNLLIHSLKLVSSSLVSVMDLTKGSSVGWGGLEIRQQKELPKYNCKMQSEEDLVRSMQNSGFKILHS
jgi:hypothetical protein